MSRDRRSGITRADGAFRRTRKASSTPTWARGGSCVADLDHTPAQLARRMLLEVKKFAGGQLPDDATIAVFGVGAA